MVSQYRYLVKMAIVTTKNESVGATCLDWQGHLRTAIRDPFELCQVLELSADIAAAAANAVDQFPLFAPRPYVNRIRKAEPHDPLLLQLLPQPIELEEHPGYVHDPVADLDSQLTPGIIQKYSGRALIVSTGACAINCRYCFRRHFPYAEAPTSEVQWEKSLWAVTEDPSIEATNLDS